MNIEILKEAGYEEAMLGLSLNKKQPLDNMDALAVKLSPLDKGHNKFLRMIQVWLQIKAPIYFWSEFDTYKVGTTASSTSTMHTLLKEIKNNQLNESCFEGKVHGSLLEEIKQEALNNNLERVKQLLPSSFYYTRVVNLNYAVLKNMVEQRYNHRLTCWKVFCKFIKNNLTNKELLDRSL